VGSKSEPPGKQRAFEAATDPGPNVEVDPVKARTATTWLGALAALLLLALPAAAQQQPPGPGPRLPGCKDPRAIARYLRLSETQVAEWKTLREALHTATQPLIAQLEPLHTSLATELDKPSPDACTAGGFVVSIDHLRDQIEDLRADYISDFEALLTPEQLVKWNALETVCHAQGVAPGVG
jgi:Spy/CpxP family protein refolding chaperone